MRVARHSHSCDYDNDNNDKILKRRKQKRDYATRKRQHDKEQLRALQKTYKQLSRQSKRQKHQIGLLKAWETYTRSYLTLSRQAIAFQSSLGPDPPLQQRGPQQHPTPGETQVQRIRSLLETADADILRGPGTSFEFCLLGASDSHKEGLNLNKELETRQDLSNSFRDKSSNRKESSNSQSGESYFGGGGMNDPKRGLESNRESLNSHKEDSETHKERSNTESSYHRKSSNYHNGESETRKERSNSNTKSSYHRENSNFHNGQSESLKEMSNSNTETFYHRESSNSRREESYLYSEGADFRRRGTESYKEFSNSNKESSHHRESSNSHREEPYFCIEETDLGRGGTESYKESLNPYREESSLYRQNSNIHEYDSSKSGSNLPREKNYGNVTGLGLRTVPYLLEEAGECVNFVEVEASAWISGPSQKENMVSTHAPEVLDLFLAWPESMDNITKTVGDLTTTNRAHTDASILTATTALSPPGGHLELLF